MTSKAYKVACGYVLGLLDANADFVSGLDKALLYCRQSFTNEDFTYFWDERVLLEEEKHLQKWMSDLLSESRPPDDIVVLWFALVCEANFNLGYVIDLCFAGDSKEDIINEGVCGFAIPEYLPRRHLAHSPFLRELAKNIDRLSFESRFLAEYILGMTYVVLAARDLSQCFAKELSRKKATTIMAGFAAGEGVIVGRVCNGIFIPFSNNGNGETAER